MTDKRLFLKAGEGRIVRREDDGELWPAEGDFAERTQFVRRRLKDGDLVEAQPPKPPKPALDEKK
ncbi:MAG: DUF2635 domain-containing protein [Bosea sp.]|uniref:DUF2635 domain-containing protein n=1 Tax=Bosea sp. (in: a-proteobacteria) TaxID=1871050 RepID=UPI0023A2427C|nr:DUF2635 domain-containing protein [Bosea sp. (in: a-proteobacteria)]MCP4734269.1 DUF2635 domain-containing protein [Bosea sp. (in: a-proteobacteria)]